MPIVENGPKSIVRDFMHVFVICKFDGDSTKNKIDIDRTTFSEVDWALKGCQWSKVGKNRICPRFHVCLKIRSKLKSLSSGQHFPRVLKPSMAGNSHAIVETGPKLNLSESLCLSSLSASLMKIRAKMKSQSSGQHFLYNVSVGD